MNKQEFLNALRAGLAGTPDEAQAVEFYEEMIDDRMEDGCTEEEAVAMLGSVEDILARSVQSLTVPKAPSPTGGISRVEIREIEYDITICPTQDSTYRLEVSDADSHCCVLENGVLRITRSKQPMKRRHFFSTSGELTLYLPQGRYDSLDVSTTSGDVAVNLDFDRVHITGASSDITLTGTFPGATDISTSSGDVSVSGVFGTVNVQTSSGSQRLQGRFQSGVCRSSSGDLEIAQASFSGNLEIQTSSGDLEAANLLAEQLALLTASGDVRLNRVCAEALSAAAKSGDISLTETLCKTEFRCKTVSGDIELEGCDCPRMVFSTTSGDISGSLRTSKQFSFHSVSGDARLPGGTVQGTCEITTVSGDAELDVEEA